MLAPDQRKKRLNSLKETQKQRPTKRKKPQKDISLQWAQISLNLPHTTFELKDLSGVLSYEVWHSHFSDAERDILTHYLPRGADPDEVVQELLSGHNFHFGNPFLKWGASLCSGKLHPGDALRREQHIKSEKKIYLSELQEYHNDMIESLQRWKDTLDSRSRKQSEKRIDLSEMLCTNEDDAITTPESSSQATSDKAWCNNNFLHIPGNRHRRNVFSDSKVNGASDGLKVSVKRQTEEKLQKRNVQHMSCIKPFEVFEEEERQKLHDYWFRLVSKEFPAFYADWRERKLKAQELVKCVCQDLEEKLKLQEKFTEQDNENDGVELATDAVGLSAGAQEDEKINFIGISPPMSVEPGVVLSAVGEHNDAWSSVRVGGSFYNPEMIGVEAEAADDDLCFHDCFISNQPDKNVFGLPKRMGLDFDEMLISENNGQFLCGFEDVPGSRMKEDWGVGSHQTWNSGLDQTLFSVLSECNAFSSPAPAPPMMPHSSDGGAGGREQSSGVSTNSMEWMGISHHNSGFLNHH